MDSGQKQCSECGEWKLPAEYYRRGGSRSHQTTSKCRACILKVQRRLTLADRRLRRVQTLARKLGMTPEEVTRAADPGATCDICGRTAEEAQSWHKHLSVDHNHRTGRFRGLLCSDCNTSLGKMGEDPARLRRAIEYLERSRE